MDNATGLSAGQFSLPLTEWTFDEYLFSNMKPSTAKHPSNKTENNGYNAKNS